jgi:putative toxin-antitoxin system antitoxin component (TIGR02293 family)
MRSSLIHESQRRSTLHAQVVQQSPTWWKGSKSLRLEFASTLIPMRTNAPSTLAENWRAVRDAFLLRSVGDQIEEIRAGIAASHLRGLAETLDVPQTAVFRLVGLSPSVARRCISLNKKLNPSASERLLMIGAIESRAVSVFGSTDLAHTWLRTRNISLGNVSPLSLLDTEPGVQEISRILNAIAYGGAV